MLKVSGKPCLYWVIKHLTNYGITDILIYTHYKADKIMDYFKDEVTYDFTPELRGTAQTVYELGKQLGKDFIVVNGDTITNCDIDELICHHTYYRIDKNLITAFYDRLGTYGGTMIVNKKALKYFKKHLMAEDVLSKYDFVKKVYKDGWEFRDIGNGIKETEEWINL
jgi:NDP-sugar pyrophosphorylase family protein